MYALPENHSISMNRATRGRPITFNVWKPILNGESAVLSHSFLRLNIMSVRSNGLTGQDKKSSLIPGLMLTAIGNTIRRRFLKLFFERTLFHDSRTIPPFYNMNEFPIHRVGLSGKNLKPALMASGAIPLVMSGVTNIPGAPSGVYRDGGVIDYHLDIPFFHSLPLLIKTTNCVYI